MADDLDSINTGGDKELQDFLIREQQKMQFQSQVRRCLKSKVHVTDCVVCFPGKSFDRNLLG